MPSEYRHTQTGVLTLAIFAAALTLFIVIGFQTGWPPVFFLAIGLLVATALVFSSLTVEIRDGTLECRFNLGFIRRRFPLSEVREARAVRNRWYYGWGIRWTPSGWMFNVSGLDAVELTLASGKRFRVGTDRPHELQAAIRRAIS